ncbi:phage tail protein [Mycolicibacterium mucogenicum]|uniref:Phage tail protein n=1 Tax=Mycolicibacterium mucogenicum TaxID=56689 RepID=A0A1A3GZU2_MYCMU|nr:phage tail protein [Mycolicibacterium mucogenicum]OBJ41320.1 phage tail protein [Mycolicibacterium mucogenicum]
MQTRAQHDALWLQVKDRQRKREKERLKPPMIRLWDGDYRLRGEVAGERAGDFEFVENDTGTAQLQLSLDHYLAKWVMDFKGREKRNVHVTFDKQGARWSGRMANYRVVKTEDGDRYLEINFKHDIEELKFIYCWANPFLRPELQFPKMWILFGPAKWCLLLTLFVNILRIETSLWTIPDNPLDINEWMPFSFNPANWRNIVKPFPFLGDNSPITIVFSRFKSFFDVAKKVLAESQLTIEVRRYLDGDPHPFEDLKGELNVDFIEDLFQHIPIRHGCAVWDIVDNSDWGEGSSWGGSLLTGLVRTIQGVSSDGMTPNVDLYQGDPEFPGDYYVPWYLGTAPKVPWVVFEEGVWTGIKSSEFNYYEATATSFLMGGHSMPGINEAISAGVNMAGDFLTSLINSALAAGGAFGTAIDLPPLGGVMDAVAKIFYEDVFFAFMEVPAVFRAGGIPGVKNGLGDFHYNEAWCDGADRAFTLSAILAARMQLWATRDRTAHTIKVSDAAPYYAGAPGYGHFWIGNRVGTCPLGWPNPFTIFVERVTRLKYSWGKDGPKGWEIAVGYREPEDPVLKAFEMIRDLNSNLGALGVL